MSELADLERTQRQRWALPGGRHDRLIRFLRVGLPSIIGILLAVLAFSPFAGTQELSFVLNKDEVSLSRERMRLMRQQVREQNVYRWAGRMLVDAARVRQKDRVLELANRTRTAPRTLAAISST